MQCNLCHSNVKYKLKRYRIDVFTYPISIGICEDCFKYHTGD